MNNKDQVISEALQKIGIPCHLRGFVYLKDSISMVLEQPMLICKMTITLYPTIAENNSTSSPMVERAIRSAIVYLWLNRDIERIAEVLGPSVTKRKMTNSEFIATLAERLRHQLLKAS